MAGNTHQYQMKRTSVSGRLANTTDPANTAYIPAGGLAVNFADRIVYTSDGANLFPIGTPTGSNLTLNVLTANVIYTTNVISDTGINIISNNYVLMMYNANNQVGAGGSSNGSALIYVANATIGSEVYNEDGTLASGFYLGDYSNASTLGVHSETAVWRFTPDGTITFPSGGTLQDGVLVGGGGATVIGSPGGAFQQVFLQGDGVFVQTSPDSGATYHTWQFGTNGIQYYPDGTQNYGSTVIAPANYDIQSIGNTYIQTSAAAGAKTWEFDTAGNITFPDTTVQSTAFTGNANTLSNVTLTTIQSQITGNAATAYSNSVTYANTKATAAYTNAVAYAANVYTNALSYANTAARNAYVNATSYANTAAYNAYANSIAVVTTGLSNGFYVAANANYAANSGALGGQPLSTIQSYITGNAATAYTNAVATAATDASTKAATAYSNAVAYISNVVTNGAVVVANAVYAQNAGALGGSTLTTIQSQITGNAATAYANAVANAAALYQTTAGLSANVLKLTANSANFIGSLPAANVVSNAQLQSNLANYAALSGASFTGVVNTSANVNIGGSVNITGNLTIAGATTFVNTSVISTTDKIIYLSANSADHVLSDGSGIVVTNAASWLYNDATFSFQSNVNITPSANSTLNLGGTGLYWNIVYSNQVYGTLLTTSQPNITANNSTYFAGVSLATVNGAITGNASAAYTNAVAQATTLAGSAYTNAVNYVANGITNGAIVAANATYAANAGLLGGSSLTTIQGQITGNAATAYTNAVATAATDASSKAATAYSNAVTQATALAGNAYTNAVATAAADASSKAATAYTNAVNYVANGVTNGSILAANATYAANSGRLQGLTWDAPGAIGSTTANTAKFTSINATSLGINTTLSLNATVIAIGNSTVNTQINATSFSGTANDVLFVGGVAASNIVSNAQLQGNLSHYTNNASLVLAQLNDTAANGATSGQVLTYSTALGKWINQNPPVANTTYTTGYYGSFYDASPTQNTASANTPTVVQIGSTFINNGVTVGSNGHINIAYPGVYQIEYSLQFQTTSNKNDVIYIWLRKNGTDIIESTSTFGIYGVSGGTNGYLIAVTPFVDNASAGDYYQIMWAASSTSVNMFTASTAFTPNTPAVIVAVFPVANLVVAPPGSNTEILFNDSGQTNTSPGFTFDRTSNSVFITNNLFVSNNINAASFKVDGFFVANTSSVAIGNSTVAGLLTVTNNTGNVVINTTAIAIGTATINAVSYSGSANAATYLANSSGTLANITSWITGNSATAYSNATVFASNASNINTGTVSAARLGSGTANSSTVLYGNNVWAAAPSGVNTAAAYTWTNTQTFNAQVNLGTNNTKLTFTANGSASGNLSYFILQNDNNFVFYNTATDGSARAIWASQTNSNTSPLNVVVPFKISSALQDGSGSNGSSGYILQSNGTGINWVSQGAASVNTFAQFTWSNTHTFNANVTFGSNIGVANGNSIYLNGLADANWRLGRSIATYTKAYYTNNSLDFLIGNSSREGITFGNIGNTSFLEMGSDGNWFRANVSIGNVAWNSMLTVNGTVTFSNSTSNTFNVYANGQVAAPVFTGNLTGTASNSSALGGTSLATLQSQITGNAATAYSNATAYADGAAATAYANAVANAAAIYQTTAGLAANVTLLAANVSSFLSNSSGTFANIVSLISSNAATAYSNATAYADSKAATAYSNAVANAAALYQTTAGLSANVLTLTSNAANFLGNSSGTIANVASWITGNAATAYTNSINYVANGVTNGAIIAANAVYSTNTGALAGVSLATLQGQITGNAATAYSNGTAYSDSKTATAYTNAVNYVANGVTNGAIIAANATLLAGQPASYYTNATNINTGTLPYARLPANVVISSNNTTFTGTTTYNANLTVSGANSASVFQVGNSSGNVIMWYDVANSSIANFGGNVNNFLQITHTNLNTGNNASTDFALFDTNGITGENYIDIGIAGNAYANAAWTILNPSDGYVYTTNSNFAIGVVGSNNINFFAGGSLLANKVMVLNSSSLALSNNISLIANGSNGSSGQVLTSNGTGVYWSSSFAGTANNATNFGGLSLATVQGQITGNAATAYSNGTAYSDGKAATAYSNAISVAAADATTKANQAYANAVANAAALYQTTAGLSANVATLTSNNSTNFGGLSLATVQSQITGNAATAYTNATVFASNASNINTGIVGPAYLGTGTANSTTVLYGNGVWAAVAAGVNTAAQYTWTNTQTFSANISITGGQLLVTNATPSGNATSGAVQITGGIGVANNIYTAGRVGFSNATNQSVVYQYYNASTNSLDTVFG
jgi:hypothetical protein